MALCMIGAVSVDTTPFPAEKISRSGQAVWPEKAVMGAAPKAEFMGEGTEDVSITGTLYPYKIGGLSQLNQLFVYMRAGTVVPVMRGDGAQLGSYAITSLSEAHSHLQRDGVGFVVSYSIKLKKMSGTNGGRLSTIEGLLSLFGF